MKVHLLSGFLGSGKTTAIQNAATILIQQETAVGVITNDQGIKLVDGNFFKSLNIASRQVINGCFCCNYNELDNKIQSLIETNYPSVIFAESVGSCADIVATVMKPLLRYRTGIDVTVSTFADARLLYMLLAGSGNSFNESVTYIYKKQLEEAGIIVISKIDLMKDRDLDGLRKMMSDQYEDKILIYQNSLDAESIQQWIDVLTKPGQATRNSSLEIDYDLYGAGEAMLAWLDQEVDIYSSSAEALGEAYNLMNLINKKIADQHYPIGHLKFLLDNRIKISFTSTTQHPATAVADKQSSTSLLINARVQTAPEILSALANDAIQEVSASSGCRIVVNSVAAFQPGYPRPTHRIAE